MQGRLQLSLVIFLAVSTQVGCPAHDQMRIEDGKQMKFNSQNRSKRNCSSISGEWILYEISEDISDRQLEEGVLQGRFLSSITLECEDNAVSGELLLYFDSRRNVAEFAPIRGHLNDGTIQLSVQRSEKCSVRYDLKPITESRLSGTFLLVGCDESDQSGGRVLAVRRFTN